MNANAINALGFVEVRGLPAAIETADCMLKTAQVRLLRQIGRDPAQISLIVEGELGACRAAVDAGKACAQRLGACMRSGRRTEKQRTRPNRFGRVSNGGHSGTRT